MKMNCKKVIYGIAGIALAGAMLASCAKKEAKVSLSFPEDFEGKTVDLITFSDSTVLLSSEIKNGAAEFVLLENDSAQWPLLAQFVVDGRVKGFYVIEPGEAQWSDTLSVAQGTPTNARFADMLKALDEAEEAEDFAVLTAAAEKLYNENKNDALGEYFGVEYLKWADPLKVDSMLNEASEKFRLSRRASRYIKYAQLRAATAPGKPYADFSGKDAGGNDISFSQYVEPGKYTLVDFMASWCPYCVKDMPKLKDIAERYKGNGLNLVSVAVRDTPEATAGAVEKHDITWNVVYDAQKRPYELYGFSGIPHYMLIGPDGTILLRNESLKNIEMALPDVLN